jgi:hypothetical protein
MSLNWALPFRPSDQCVMSISHVSSMPHVQLISFSISHVSSMPHVQLVSFSISRAFRHHNVHSGRVQIRCKFLATHGLMPSASYVEIPSSPGLLFRNALYLFVLCMM